MKYDIQINQGAADWKTLRDAVVAAESVGFRTAWVLDHISSFGRSEVSMLECFTALGAIAASTSSIGLGSLVANAQLRNHSLLAASATSVQNISGGRFTLGIGAGAAPASRWGSELSELGLPPLSNVALRHANMEKALITCRAHWSGGATNMPTPIVAPRVIVGVNSVELALLATRCADGINIRADHPQLEQIIGATGSHRNANPEWEVSVWAPWDPQLVNLGHFRIREWESIGVNAVALVHFKAPRVSEIEGVNIAQ